MLKGYVSNLTRATLILCVYSPPPSSLHSTLSASLSASVHVSDSWLILQRGKGGRVRGELINHLFIQSKVNKNPAAVLRKPSIEPLTPTDALVACLPDLISQMATVRINNWVKIIQNKLYVSNVLTEKSRWTCFTWGTCSAAIRISM